MGPTDGVGFTTQVGTDMRPPGGAGAARAVDLAAMTLTLFRGGRIHAAADPDATALAVSGSTISWIGGEHAVGLLGTADRVVDLRGALVIPGFVDAHVHTTEAGLALSGLDLSGTRSLAQCLAAVGEFAARNPDGVLWGHGWEDTRWPEHRPPTRAELDLAVGDRPAYLSRVDVHSAQVSSALAAAVADGPGLAGWSATGAVTQQAHAAVRAAARQRLSAGQRSAAQLAFLRAATANGIVEVHECAADGATGRADLAALLSLDGPIPVRGYLAAAVTDPAEARRILFESGAHALGGDLTVDGAIGSRTAALRRPYDDAPGDCGVRYLGDLLVAEVAHPTVARRVVVRPAEGGGSGPDRTVDGEVAAEGVRTALEKDAARLRGVGERSGEIAPDRDRAVQREQRRQVGPPRGAVGRALVYLDDAVRRRGAQERELRRGSLTRRKPLPGNGSDGGVGLLRDRPGGRPAGEARPVRDRGGQRRADLRRMHVHPGQVGGTVADGEIQLRAGRRTVFRPSGVLPPVPPQHTVGVPRGELTDGGQALRQRAGAGQVEAGQREPGLGGVHVRVDESRDHQRTAEIDDPIGGAEQSDGVLATDPADRRTGHGKSGGVGIGGGMDPAAAEQGEGHRRQVNSTGGSRTAGRPHVRAHLSGEPHPVRRPHLSQWFGEHDARIRQRRGPTRSGDRPDVGPCLLYTSPS